MTTHANSASDEPSPPENETPGHLHALPRTASTPGEDLILEQIRETVRRVTAASLRASSAGDVLITGQLATDRALPWVWYALRSTPLRVFVPTTPEEPTPAVLTWTAAASPSLTLRLAHERQADDALVFETPRFALMALNDRAWLAALENPNGLETWGSWLGTEDITIHVKAESATVVTIRFDADPGPSRPESPERDLVLLAGDREVSRVQRDLERQFGQVEVLVREELDRRLPAP